MLQTERIIVSTAWVSIYAGSLLCALLLKGQKSKVFLCIAVFLALATSVLLVYFAWLFRDGMMFTPPHPKSEGIEAVNKVARRLFASLGFWFLCTLVVMPVVLYLARKRKVKNA